MYERIIEMFAPVNATNSFYNGGDTITNIFLPIILIAIATTTLAVLLHVSASIEKYRRFKRLFTYLAKTLSYAAYGSLTIVIIGIPIVGLYWVGTTVQSNPEGSIEILKWIGIMASGYIGLTLLGYATKNRIWKRIVKFRKIDKEYKNNIKELPKVLEVVE